MGTKTKRYRNKAILTAYGLDDAVIERLEIPLKEFKETTIPMLANAKYRASKGIAHVYGQLWGPGADFEPLGRYYSENGKAYHAIGWDGAPPLLLPVSLLPKWLGNLMPLTDESRAPDDRLPEGDFVRDDDFDFENPKTDYDRICALGLEGGNVNRVRVGRGIGLTFASDEPWIWWEPQKMLVGAGLLPSAAQLDGIKWNNELTWEAQESRFVLMNSCCYGRELKDQKPDDDYFKVRLQPGKYIVQFAKVGEHGPNLFRFVLKRPGRPAKKRKMTAKSKSKGK